ncbi:hypothetical protein ACEQPO_26620 [Bacillus sp. SL00103]
MTGNLLGDDQAKKGSSLSSKRKRYQGQRKTVKHLTARIDLSSINQRSKPKSIKCRNIKNAQEGRQGGDTTGGQASAKRIVLRRLPPYMSKVSQAGSRDHQKKWRCQQYKNVGRSG